MCYCMQWHCKTLDIKVTVIKIYILRPNKDDFQGVARA